ncbi:MAG: ABC transporter ATP-binding protein/permease [Firmicutes bacterium]|nr:ABC transporter ATP-binding protein/permease [Bacillota bacterium]
MNTIQNSFKYAKKYLPAYLGIILCGLIFVTTITLIPQIPQLIVDRLIFPVLGGNPQYAEGNIFSFAISNFSSTDYVGMFVTLLIILVSLLLLRYTAFYIRGNLQEAYGVKLELDFRHLSYQKMLREGDVARGRRTMGDMMSILNSDPSRVKDFWSRHITMIVDQIYIIILAVIFLSLIHPLTIIIPFICGISFVILTFFYIKQEKKFFNKIRDAQADLNSVVTENINGVRIVRSYASEKIEEKKFVKKSENFRDKFIGQTKMMTKYEAIFRVMILSSLVASTGLGVYLAAIGSITVGQFATFNAYGFMIGFAFDHAAKIIGQVQHSFVCGKRMFDFINEEDEIKNIENPKTIEGMPNITVQNISVKYDEKEVLKDISFTLPHGKKLGIMGKTGSGKSVLLRTLSRLKDIEDGEILINFDSIKEIDIENVRAQFSVVFQEVFLFSNTIDANIAYFNPEVSHEDVLKASKISQGHEFIQHFKDGYETIIGEKGLGLSGGQKQRVSIARALLKNAPILVLDDCTSALDLSTERKILDGIFNEYGSHSLIIASHRVASVENCDEILFLEDGQIKERGTHNELLELGGRYSEIYEAQKG